MQKRLVVQRSTDPDWYNKAKDFLSDNKCKPLKLTVSPDANPGFIFQQALASLNARTNQQFTIDADAGVLLVTADLVAAVSPGQAACACQCGQQGNCGGSGSGSGTPV